ncbi:MAG: flavin reductase family protein, partial [Pseudomonadota bacterium]
MHFSSADIPRALAYKLLVSTVIPRPIAFVTTISSDGIANVAPYSFFNAMGSAPPVVAIGFEPTINDDRKDTSRNILETEEFVVNIVDEAMSVQMNQAAATLPPEVHLNRHRFIDNVHDKLFSFENVSRRVFSIVINCRLEPN